MKQTLLILFAITISGICFEAAAQDSNGATAHETASTPEYPEFLNNITVGLFFGPSIPTMRYSDPMFDDYDKRSVFSGMGGLFVDWNFYDNWSVRPHLGFTGRGVNMEYSPLFIDYKLESTYFDFRIPIVYTFDTNSQIRPYVTAGPSFNFATGGKSYYAEGAESKQVYELKLAKSNFRTFDLGIYMGAGFDYPIQINGFPMMIGAEVGYNLGLMDTFAKGEKNNESIAINLPVYNVAGSRKNSNISVAVNVSIPLKNIFGKKKKTKKQTYIPAPVVQVKENVVERKVSVQEKQCCTLDEMYEFILGGEDISMKKICAFSDIRFDFDEATLRPESEEYLDKFVTILTKFPSIHLSIIGHTDNVGDSQYNMQLSKKRAEAVAEYFIENGVDSSRLLCYGYGSRQPLTENSTSEGRAMNRRVEFDILEGTF